MLETGFQTLESRRQKLHIKAPVDTVQPPCLSIGPFIGADQDALLLLPVVAGSLGITHHRRLVIQSFDFGKIFGHKIMVLHVDDRKIKAHPFANLLGKTAGCIDQVLADNRALISGHFPFAIIQKPGSGYPCVPVDRGSALTRACSHGVGRAGRVSVTIVGRIKPELDIVHHQQWM